MTEAPLPKFVDFEPSGEVKDYQLLAKSALLEYYNTCMNDQKDEITLNDIFVVWFSKVLRNWKAMISTTRQDDLYYELTFDGEKNQLYIDVYLKKKNVVWYIAPIPR